TAQNVVPMLSLSGPDAVITYVTQGTSDWIFQWNSLACFATGDVLGGLCTAAGSGNGAGGWNGGTNLTLRTEFGVGFGSASPVSYTVGAYNLIGVLWNDGIGNPVPGTNRMRFSVISMSPSGVVNFPVTVTLSYWE